MENRKVFVLDTTALLSTQFEPGPVELITVQEVVDEVLYGGLALERISAALSTHTIKLKKPTRSSLEMVRLTARDTGDLPKLSKADLMVLAAAFDEFVAGNDVVVVSDDFSLQNTALRLGLKVIGVGRNVVREMREWAYRCHVCGKIYSRPVTRCSICGGETDRIIKKP